jgi:hypothetical protein
MVIGLGVKGKWDFIGVEKNNHSLYKSGYP